MPDALEGKEAPSTRIMFPDPQYLLYGAMGALCLELLQTQLYKGRLTPKVVAELYRSRVYWLSISALILGAALLAWGLHAGEKAKIREVFITGLAAQTILRDIIAIKVKRSPRKLGPVTLHEVFA